MIDPLLLERLLGVRHGIVIRAGAALGIVLLPLPARRIGEGGDLPVDRPIPGVAQRQRSVSPLVPYLHPLRKGEAPASVHQHHGGNPLPGGPRGETDVPKRSGSPPPVGFPLQVQRLQARESLRIVIGLVFRLHGPGQQPLQASFQLPLFIRPACVLHRRLLFFSTALPRDQPQRDQLLGAQDQL